MLPGTLLGERHQTLERLLGDDGKVDTLKDVLCSAVETIEEVGAARTWLLTLGPEHEAVDRERVLDRREQLGKFQAPDPALRTLAFEDIVFGDFAAFRQGAALCGDAFDVPAQLHFFLQERIAR